MLFLGKNPVPIQPITKLLVYQRSRSKYCEDSMNCFDSVFTLLRSINQGRVSMASPGLIVALTCKGFERKEMGFYPMHSIHEGGVLLFFLTGKLP